MKKRPIDWEHKHQANLIKWVRLQKKAYPGLERLFSVPNAGKRSPRLGAYYKAEGLLPGTPDLCLPVARMGYHSLFIEMKVPKTAFTNKTYPSAAQKEQLQGLADEGNLAVVCWGWEAAQAVLKRYLRGDTRDPTPSTTMLFLGYLKDLNNVKVFRLGR